MDTIDDLKALLSALKTLQTEYQAVADRKLPVDLHAAKKSDWQPGGGIEGKAVDFYTDAQKKYDNQKVMRCYTACANLLTLENQLVQLFVANPGGIIYDDFRKMRGFGKLGAKAASPVKKLFSAVLDVVEKTPILKTLSTLQQGGTVTVGEIGKAILHPGDALSAGRRIVTLASEVTGISVGFYFLSSLLKSFGVQTFQQKVASVAAITEAQVEKLRNKALSQYASTRRRGRKQSRKN